MSTSSPNRVSRRDNSGKSHRPVRATPDYSAFTDVVGSSGIGWARQRFGSGISKSRDEPLRRMCLALSDRSRSRSALLGKAWRILQRQTIRGAVPLTGSALRSEGCQFVRHRQADIDIYSPIGVHAKRPGGVPAQVCGIGNQVDRNSIAVDRLAGRPFINAADFSVVICATSPKWRLYVNVARRTLFPFTSINRPSVAKLIWMSGLGREGARGRRNVSIAGDTARNAPSMTDSAIDV